MSVGQELLNVPFSEMVYQMANSIAEAQKKLDENSVEILREMGDVKKAPVSLPSLILDKNGKLVEHDIETSMIGAGFQPTFYQFAETIIEVKMAITVNSEFTSEQEQKGKKLTYARTGKGYRVCSTPINATYSSKYNYTQEGASTLRTRLVPVPPNTIVQRQIELKAQHLAAQFEQELAEAEESMN
ncbi:MAG: hypothetical protein IJ833_03430 [Lachnospiraceae bacterium]|nr:hypothetical protein [Lachnospiraceae bacterium]